MAHQQQQQLPTGGRWYVDSDDMGFIKVDDNYNTTVETAFHRGDRIVSLSTGRFTYTIDLSGLYQQPPSSSTPLMATQKNNNTGRLRALRRYVTSNHIWEFHEVGTTFRCFNNSEILEDQYNTNPTSQYTMISPSGYTLVIDFHQMVQTNQETGKVRPIRRVPRNGGGGSGGAATAAVVAPPSVFGGGGATATTSGGGGVGSNNVGGADADATIWQSVDGQVTLQDDQQQKQQQCVICLCDMDPSTEEVVELRGCKSHMYHKECLQPMLQQSPSGLSLKCPICKQTSGTPETGNQPKNGSMTVTTTQRKGKVHGLDDDGVIVIKYNFPNGIQGTEHPSPGSQYHGTSRTAYLPNTPQGNEVLRLLRIAWDRRLIFTVGTSVTSGQSNCVVWAGIHHKTSTSGGTYGYPDDTYIARVKGELSDRGVC